MCTDQVVRTSTGTCLGVSKQNLKMFDSDTSPEGGWDPHTPFQTCCALSSCFPNAFSFFMFRFWSQALAYHAQFCSLTALSTTSLQPHIPDPSTTMLINPHSLSCQYPAPPHALILGSLLLALSALGSLVSQLSLLSLSLSLGGPFLSLGQESLYCSPSSLPSPRPRCRVAMLCVLSLPRDHLPCWKTSRVIRCVWHLGLMEKNS